MINLILVVIAFVVIVWILDKLEGNKPVPPGAIEKITQNMFRDIKDIPQDEYDALNEEICNDLNERREKIRRE